MQTETKYVQKVKAIRDEDGHWYVIPNDLEYKFHKLLDGGEETVDKFIKQFDQYRVNGDLNNVQLYAETTKDIDETECLALAH